MTLDADTIFEPDALPMLLRHFADPKVAPWPACTGVGNRVNVLTRFQALEYVTNQNLDRRALEIVNGITVVPGAIGAWRREAVLSIGGFVPDTLAEDADTTISLAVAGWKIVYEPRAPARTEAPETLKGFMSQRMRWMFGTLQVAYKHRHAMLRGRPIGIGVFGLPNIVRVPVPVHAGRTRHRPDAAVEHRLRPFAYAMQPEARRAGDAADGWRLLGLFPAAGGGDLGLAIGHGAQAPPLAPAAAACSCSASATASCSM